MNQQTTTGIDFRPIINMMRTASIILLLLHFYIQNLVAFQQWGFNSEVTDRIVQTILENTFQGDPILPKLAAFLFLALSLLGSRGKKDPGYTAGAGIRNIVFGLTLFFGSQMVIGLDYPNTHIAVAYMILCSGGYLMMIQGANYLSRVIWDRQKTDTFNRIHESFPQEERRIENEYSVHFPSLYEYQGEVRNSVISLINLFRGTLLIGNPGSMKTVGFVEPLIKQLIEKGFSLVIHDLKSPKLSQLAWYHFHLHRNCYPPDSEFIHINLEDPARSHRINALPPSMLRDISDAAEAARGLLMGLNKEMAEKPGEFFAESAINYLTGVIWFLRIYENGKYCTWPHVIELASVPHKELFPLLRAYPEMQSYVQPFIESLELGAGDTLGGQLASAKIGFARLASPSIYYILTGNDFTLDINNPRSPKILTLGNNPQKTSTYGAVLSLYINTINRHANRPGMNPLCMVLEECASLYVNSLEQTLATGRENGLAVFMVVQDLTQLRLVYGKKYADVLFNICGNIISGQTSGDTAEELSKRFGRIQQPRESLSINSSDTSITQSHQLDPAIPPSRIAKLSSGEFVGIVADNPDQRIDLKAFSARLVMDFKALNAEKSQYKELPILRTVTDTEIMDTFLGIKQDIRTLVTAETIRLWNTPDAPTQAGA